MIFAPAAVVKSLRSAMESRNMETYVITTAVIRNKDKYLIAKRAITKKFAPNQWEFISGFIDTPESPEEIIIREIKEELGATARIIKKSDSFDFTDDEGKWTVIPFLVELDIQNIKVNQEDHSEIKWVVASELNCYPDLEPFLNNIGIKELLRK